MNSSVLVFAFFIGLCSSAPKNGRIVGGSPAKIKDYPSIVQIEVFEFEFWQQWCGGSIINNYYILTAAHCFMWHDVVAQINDFRIRVGSELRETGGDVYEVSAILNHPEFIYDYPCEPSLEADISLMRLRSSLVFSDVVQPIAIVPLNFVVPDNVPVAYAGWGAVKTGGPAPDVLLHVEVLTINREICAESYANAKYPLIPANVTEKMVCAGLPGYGACHGDSGGPLIYGGVLVGIISFGSSDCAFDGYPEVSTRVASYTDWVVDNAV